MEYIIHFAISIVITTVVGFICYFVIVNTESANNLFKIVPLYPKPKYAIFLYFLSGLLYFLISQLMTAYGLVFGLVGEFVVAIFCVMFSSQVIRLIAQLRNDNIEETADEEIERKRRQYYGD